VPGLANKLLARIVDRIFLSLPCAYPFPREKTILTGNPVRGEIVAAAAKKGPTEKKEITILILGGSQGAHRVNLLVTEAVARLVQGGRKEIQVIHQTGAADEQQVRTRYAELGVQAEVQSFFADMAGLYSSADLVVSRAGATTLAELSVMGLPALLIPYPYAADDHQKTNALHYQEGGAARMLPESELSGENLADEMKKLMDDPKLLVRMAISMINMGRPEATERIIDECLQLIDQKTSRVSN
jgi:UDP-N-acetylglucosamine--N-acetylmuramyl-(pentapeptide) pyrophosphoryl-undecaprenol N-acetylglucosamine transferase